MVTINLVWAIEVKELDDKAKTQAILEDASNAFDDRAKDMRVKTLVSSSGAWPEIEFEWNDSLDELAIELMRNGYLGDDPDMASDVLGITVDDELRGRLEQAMR